MYRKIVFIFLLIYNFNPINVKADEGMWLPLLIERLNYTDMQNMGLQLTPEEIYSINHSSLKDAIVHFKGGCTAELISPNGLIITNHHCGYGDIQELSTIEHDYLSDGFWAKNMSEELKCEGLTVKFLVRMEDVTARVLAVINDTMNEENRTKKIWDISKQIQDEATLENHYIADVKSFFNGNEYYLFVYETYKDVRLVGTPPQSLGKFGGDTDNWMWPRHTCDFSMFRIYSAPDGKPADYSPNNIPLRSKHYLPISIKGIEKSDFTMVMGYPGTTDRFLTSYGVKMAIEKYNPSIVKIREKKLEIMKEDMNKSDVIRIKYSAKYAAISNYWKYFLGQTKNLKQLKVYNSKMDIENRFTQWINQDNIRYNNYGNALKEIENGYEEMNKIVISRIYFYEALLRGSELFSFAKNFESLEKLLISNKKDKSAINHIIDELIPVSENFYKNYNASTDKKLMTATLEMYYNDVPKDQQPKVIADIANKYGKDFKKFTERVYNKSVFADEVKIKNFLKSPSHKTIKNDIFYSIMKELNSYLTEINKKTDEINKTIESGNRKFVKGLMEMQPEKKFYPNANSTMRMTYGTVQDYYPADAVHYDYYTTLEGLMEKEDPNNEEFIVPEKIKQLYKTKDYGIYGQNGSLVTCFITNNDITGGNSGSPVINKDGHLIGLAFDGNWEAMSGNISYNPDMQRCICVDIRFVLFIIDKFAGASNIINEMKIISNDSSQKSLYNHSNIPQEINIKSKSNIKISTTIDNPSGLSVPANIDKTKPINKPTENIQQKELTPIR